MPSLPTRPRRGPWWRVALGVAVAVAGGCGAALLLGEYDFAGLLPWIGGPVLGVAVAEVQLVVTGRRSVLLGTIGGLIAAGALLWAAWISSGRGLTTPPWGLGPGMAMAVAAGVLWTGADRVPPGGGSAPRIRVRRRPERRSR